MLNTNVILFFVFSMFYIIRWIDAHYMSFEIIFDVKQHVE